MPETLAPPEKSVFISYRHDLTPLHAQAIFMDLRPNSFDVFIDHETIKAGTFDPVILNQIGARAHFLLVLAPGSLERCADPNDRLRREIEQAITLERNIVPVMIGGFRFEDVAVVQDGPLAGLKRYNGLNLHADYFEAGMERLRTRFLTQPVKSEVKPADTEEMKLVQAQMAEMAGRAAPSTSELNAEECFFKAFARRKEGDSVGALDLYNKAIEAWPDYDKAYYNRGLIRYDEGEPEAALADFGAAVRITPDYLKARYNRGVVYSDLEKWAEALADFDAVLAADPKFAGAYNNRGLVYMEQENVAEARQDFDTAIRLSPNMSSAYLNRARLHEQEGRSPEALADYQRYLELGGGKSYGNSAEIKLRVAALEKATSDTLPSAESRPAPQKELLDRHTPAASAPSAAASPAATPDEKNGLLALLEGLAALLRLPAEFIERLAGRLAERDAPEQRQPTRANTRSSGGMQGPRPDPTRPLPPAEAKQVEQGVPSGTGEKGLRFGYASHTGQVRENNQDSVLVGYVGAASEVLDGRMWLFMVADGMGGHEAGEKASAQVNRALHQAALQHFYSRPDLNATQQTILQVMQGAIRRANHAIIYDTPDGGTTVTALVLGSGTYSVVHVGDTRAYLVTGDAIEQLTHDHSLVQRLIDLEQLTPEEALDHPQSNVLYRAVGQNEDLQVDTLTRGMPDGAWFVLCSDGLWNLVSDEEMAATVRQQAPQAACDALVALANARGGKDNVSVVVVWIG